MATVGKVPVIIKNKTRLITTPMGEVSLNEFRKVNIRCENRKDVNVGDRVRIIAGKKLELGTEATVKAIGRNKFEIVPGNNPCLLLIPDNAETEIWITGKNCCNISDLGIENKIRELDEFEMCGLNLEAEGLISAKDIWYLEDSDRILVHSSIDGSDVKFAVEAVKRSAKNFAVIAKDFSKEEYIYVVLPNDLKANNCQQLSRNESRTRLLELMERFG